MPLEKESIFMSKELVNSIGIANSLSPRRASDGKIYITVEVLVLEDNKEVNAKQQVPLESKEGEQQVRIALADQVKRVATKDEWNDVIEVLKGRAKTQPVKDPQNPMPLASISERSAITGPTPLPTTLDFLLSPKGDVKVRFNDPTDGRTFPANHPIVKAALSEILTLANGIEPKSWEQDRYLKRCMMQALRSSRKPNAAEAMEDLLDQETGVLAIKVMMIARNKAGKKWAYEGTPTELRRLLESVCDKNDLDKTDLPNVKIFRDYYETSRKDIMRVNNLRVVFRRSGVARKYKVAWIDDQAVPDWVVVSPDWTASDKEEKKEEDLFELSAAATKEVEERAAEKSSSSQLLESTENVPPEPEQTGPEPDLAPEVTGSDAKTGVVASQKQATEEKSPRSPTSIGGRRSRPVARQKMANIEGLDALEEEVEEQTSQPIE